MRLANGEPTPKKEEDFAPTEYSEWMIKTIDYELSNFSNELWTPDMNKVANDFLKDTKALKLYVWIEGNTAIRHSVTEPPNKNTFNVADNEFIFFLKTRNDLHPNKYIPAVGLIYLYNFENFPTL